MSQNELGLRARKHARTKLGLLNAFIDELEHKAMEEVRIRDLCERVDISQATFFNYFEGKGDLIIYFIQLWSIEQGWAAHRLLEQAGAVAALRGIFTLTARRVEQHPRVMAEILAAQARLETPPRTHEISLAERRERFAELDGIDELPAQGLGSLLPSLIDQAVSRGELSPTVDRNLLFVTLSSLFFGTPIALRHSPELLADTWEAQLDQIFGALMPPTGLEPRKGACS